MDISTFPCPEDYTRISTFLQWRDDKENITILRSDLGERLKIFSLENDKTPEIRQSVVNNDRDLFVFNFTYGCIQTVYVTEMQILVNKFIRDVDVNRRRRRFLR
ncbi:unnamed protein product [Macrosiphum euphorbiae]|nr:unnamed protein product [Macrosiphum euphorbiae]